MVQIEGLKVAAYAGEESNQFSLFNETEAETKRNTPEPDKVSVAGHTWKAKRTKEELKAEILCELNEEEQGNLLDKAFASK